MTPKKRKAKTIADYIILARNGSLPLVESLMQNVNRGLVLTWRLAEVVSSSHSLEIPRDPVGRQPERSIQWSSCWPPDTVRCIMVIPDLLFPFKTKMREREGG